MYCAAYSVTLRSGVVRFRTQASLEFLGGVLLNLQNVAETRLGTMLAGYEAAADLNKYRRGLDQCLRSSPIIVLVFQILYLF